MNDKLTSGTKHRGHKPCDLGILATSGFAIDTLQMKELAWIADQQLFWV